MADYIILRDIAEASLASPFNVPSSRSRAPESAGLDQPLPRPRLESATLTAREARDVARDPTVKAIAPPIGLTLIRPVADDADQPAASASAINWGIDAVGATASEFSGEDVVVAVLDTGIDETHPAFQGMDLVVRDFTGEGPGDQDGHGTHCAGTIFGRDVGGTRIGVARGVERALIGKVLGVNGGSSQMLFEALPWAANNGANIISMSLGFDFPGLVGRFTASGIPQAAAVSRALLGYGANLRMFDTLMRMIRQSAPFGVDCLVIAASGNESNRPQFEIAASLPSAAETVVAIGAVGQAVNGKFPIARFSNTFPQLVAPGVGIVSAKANDPGTVSLSGTSMATPHVAGVAALWWEAKRQIFDGEIGPVVLAELLANARSDVFAPGFDGGDFGFGMVTAP